MVIKSFGCSFIFGSELSDVGWNGPVALGSRETWPALIANELGYEYQCFARPGSGNLQIFDRFCNHPVDPRPTFYIIGWTWIDRFDYINPDGPDWRPILDPNKWSTIMPADSNNVSETYYKNLHSEYQDKLTSLIYIKTAIDILKSRGQQFIMTYMDDLLFDTKFNTSPAITQLQDYIRPYMTRFDDMNFLDWSKKKGFLIGPESHPLEQAHEAAAQYILELGIHKK